MDNSSDDDWFEVPSKFKTKNQKQFGKKKVLIVLPFAFVFSGRYEAMEIIQESLQNREQWNSHFLVMDNIRTKLMNQAIKDKNLTKEQAHKDTMHQSFQLFEKAIEDICRECTSKAKNDLNLIWVDKNFPPTNIHKTLKKFRTSLDKNFTPIFLQLIPQIQNIDVKNLPFSQEYLLSCFLFATKKDNDGGSIDHNPENPIKTFEVMLNFLNTNKNITFDQKFLDKYELNDFLMLPLTFKHTLQITEEHIDLLTNTLFKEEGKNFENISALIEKIKDDNITVQKQDQDKINDSAFSQFEKFLHIELINKYQEDKKK